MARQGKGIDMTDVDTLNKCLEAFEAMKSADDAKRFLRKHGEKHQSWAGTGQMKLRRHMMTELKKQLGLGEFSA